MIVEQNQNLTIEQTSPFKRKAFTIVNSKEAFRILSKGVYSDPITAVIREISTNAADGHKLASIGTDEVKAIPGRDLEPFNVYLPTALNPTFRVRDRGVGLSEQQIFDMYTTYFDSSKRESNDFNGSLGIGSKSPFAVVSSFLVTSYYNGVQSTYTAIIGEDGCPDIVKMTSVKTDEENGVEIKFTVAPEDIYNFEERAKNVYKHFEVAPNVFKGNQQIVIEKDIYTFEGDGFAFAETNYYTSDKGAYVVQSNVRYPIDLEPLEGKISADRLRVLRNEQQKLTMFFDNGQVNFTASREALEYTPLTIKNIDEKITKILEAVRVEYDEVRQQAESFIEAVDVISEACNQYSYQKYKTNSVILHSLFAQELATKGSIQWRDKKITEDMFKGIPVTLSQTFKKNEFKVENGIVIPFSNTLGFTIFNQNGDKASAKTTIKFEQAVRVKTNLVKRDILLNIVPVKTVFLVNDSKIAQYKLVEHIKKTYGGTKTNIYVFHPDHIATMKTIQNAIHVKEYSKTSDADVSDVERRSLIKTVRIFKNGKIYDKVVDDLSDISYYVVAKGSAYTFEMFDRTYTYEVAQRVFSDLITNQILTSTEEIAILPGSSVEKILTLYSKMKPIKNIIKDISWNNLPQVTKISMTRKYMEEVTGLTNAIDNIANVHKNMAIVETKNHNLKTFMNKVTATYKKVEKTLTEMNSHHYRYNTIDKDFSAIINVKIKADPDFVKSVTELEAYAEDYKQVTSQFPIMTIINKFEPAVFTRYVEADWNNNQKELH